MSGTDAGGGADPDAQRRDFRTIATTLGADPDLAVARAMQLGRDQTERGLADVYLTVLAELCEGRV